MGQMDVWNLNGVTGNVITYDGRYDGAVNADGSAAGGEEQGQQGQDNQQAQPTNP